MTDEAREEGWVVRHGEPDIPVHVVEDARAGQASLASKLAELRTTREPFPAGSAPAAADSWIADGGERASVRSRPDGDETS